MHYAMRQKKKKKIYIHTVSRKKRQKHLRSVPGNKNKIFTPYQKKRHKRKKICTGTNVTLTRKTTLQLCKSNTDKHWRLWHFSSGAVVLLLANKTIMNNDTTSGSDLVAIYGGSRVVSVWLALYWYQRVDICYINMSSIKKRQFWHG